MSLGGLLGGRIKKEAAKPAPPTALDELEQYLADTEEPTIDVKVLLWWKEKEAKWRRGTARARRAPSAARA